MVQQRYRSSKRSFFILIPISFQVPVFINGCVVSQLDHHNYLYSKDSMYLYAAPYSVLGFHLGLELGIYFLIYMYTALSRQG